MADQVQAQAGVSISPRLQLRAILDAPKHEILIAVKCQIKRLQSNLIKALSDLAGQI